VWNRTLTNLQSRKRNGDSSLSIQLRCFLYRFLSSRRKTVSFNKPRTIADPEQQIEYGSNLLRVSLGQQVTSGFVDWLECCYCCLTKDGACLHWLLGSQMLGFLEGMSLQEYNVDSLSTSPPRTMTLRQPSYSIS
jgi:hypothetical protein